MAFTTTTDVLDDYLHIKFHGTFTLSSAVTITKEAFAESVKFGKTHIFMDASAITHPEAATNKLLWALEIEQFVRTFSARHGYIPRVAGWGLPPFISTYKPASDYLQSQNISIRVFDDREHAIRWLLEDRPA